MWREDKNEKTDERNRTSSEGRKNDGAPTYPRMVKDTVGRREKGAERIDGKYPTSARSTAS